MAADPGLDIWVETALREAGLSAEARRLVEANFNGNSLAAMSQFNLIRSAAVFRAGRGPVFSISGGSQRLPEGMARAIASPIRFGQVVSAIEETSDQVRITANDRTLAARHAICTIPSAALRSVALATDLEPAIASSIGALNYTRASFAFIEASEPFWKTDA